MCVHLLLHAHLKIEYMGGGMCVSWGNLKGYKRASMPGS